MHHLLIEPNFRSSVYAPIGLMRIASALKDKGDTVELIRREHKMPKQKPDKMWVTSLFTYDWEAVWKSVQFYKKVYPDVELWLGGIYASLMPEHAKQSGADYVHEGLLPMAEEYPPDYSLVPEYLNAHVFMSRGCVNRCKFCAVPKIEGKLVIKKNLRNQIMNYHRVVYIEDNNIVAHPDVHELLDILSSEYKDKYHKFNGGIDARIVGQDIEIARSLAKIKKGVFFFAYDNPKERTKIERCLDILEKAEFKTRQKGIFYALYNFRDTPQDFFERCKFLIERNAMIFPMKYQPLDTLKKDSYISPTWNMKELKFVKTLMKIFGKDGKLFPDTAMKKTFAHFDNFEDLMFYYKDRRVVDKKGNYDKRIYTEKETLEAFFK